MKPDIEALIAGLRTEMSVQEIARRAGLSRNHVHRIAAGDVKRPSFETVTKLQRLVDRTTKSAAMPKVGIVTRKV